MQPINFWNASQQPVQSGNALTWHSITTGGLSGLVLTVKEAAAGYLRGETVQGAFQCELSAISEEPMITTYDGLCKQLAIYRLPDYLPTEISLDIPVTELRAGDNPLYIRVNQQDGHLAWSSPIYVCRQ